MHRWGVAAWILGLAACAAPTSSSPSSAAAQHAPGVRGAFATATFAHLVALQGDWVAADGGPHAPVAVSYRTTGAGSAVIETLWPGTADEMLSIYSCVSDGAGAGLVLTHYCTAGNQPHMRLVKATEHSADFEFDGGANIDPQRDMHMHAVSHEFVSPDELRTTWHGWVDGHDEPAHTASFRFVRKPRADAPPAEVHPADKAPAVAQQFGKPSETELLAMIGTTESDALGAGQQSVLTAGP